MAATTPLWVSVLLAVLTPVLTLAGVLWSQRASDRRAVREAELRLQAQREEHLADRRFQTYTEVLGLLDKKSEHLSSRSYKVQTTSDRDTLYRDFRAIQSDLSDAMTQLTVVGNQEAIVLAMKSDDALVQFPGDPDVVRAVSDDFYEHRRQFIRAIRKDWGTAEELKWEEIADRRDPPYTGPST